MNHVVLTGRLTRDPESRKLASGKTVTEFAVATNDYRGGSEKAEYHPVVTWDRLAEICGQYLVKGQKVYVEGRLQTREWEGKDGAKRNRTEIVCENMIMLSRGNGAAAGAPRAAAGRDEEQPVPASASAEGNEEIRVEDIPF